LPKSPSSAAGFHCLTSAIDTTTPEGQLYSITGAFVEFEREVIRQRTRAGLKSTLARGWKEAEGSHMTIPFDELKALVF
jgi:DNA invertase Pin-like site-specific DNA recombinase